VWLSRDRVAQQGQCGLAGTVWLSRKMWFNRVSVAQQGQCGLAGIVWFSRDIVV
jgi:hypothetical protein